MPQPRKKYHQRSRYVPVGGEVPAHIREFFSRCGKKGGASKSLKKLDACRINARMAGRPKGSKNGVNRRDRYLAGEIPPMPSSGMKLRRPLVPVPPMDAVTAWCSGLGCTFEMLLSSGAMAALRRKQIVRWTCPACHKLNHSHFTLLAQTGLPPL